MSQVIERTKIALNAIGMNILNRFRRQPKTGRVLIIFQQVFGDSILLLPALEGYVELYYRRRGMEVTLICLPQIHKFMKDVGILPKELKVEEVDFKKMFNDYGYFHQIVNRYSTFADIAVATGTSLSADLLSTCLRTKERHGMLNCYRVTWPPHLALFQRLAYTDAIIPQLGSMAIQKHRIMLRHLGLENYQGRLTELRKLPRLVEGNYCVICPGASTKVKRWPIDRFRDIADMLISIYDFDVYLCGGFDERDDAERLISLSKHKKRIHNWVGETTFSEWSQIVQHAELVLGNDSATLHIAAATQRRCICITGVYDKFAFFPYLVDDLRDGERLPITVIKDKPCAYCRTKNYFAGTDNPACKKDIKAGYCALCISEVTVEEVKAAVDEILSKKTDSRHSPEAEP